MFKQNKQNLRSRLADITFIPLTSRLSDDRICLMYVKHSLNISPSDLVVNLEPRMKWLLI